MNHNSINNEFKKKDCYNRSNLLVEMAGVEPASERIDPRIYYERSSFIYFVSIGKMNKTDQDYLLGPESPLLNHAAKSWSAS